MSKASQAIGETVEIGRSTPASVENRPGLERLARRIGGRHDFLASMLADFDGRAAGVLTTRTDDASVAVLDAAAVMLDVVTLYTEETAQEHYLGTARDRSALQGLAALTGAELGAGRAAETLLAFELEQVPPGTRPGPGELPRLPKIPKGTRVQSVPEPGGKPVVFETVEDFTGRAGWNAARLLLTGTTPASYVDTGAARIAAALPIKAGARIFLDGASVTRIAEVADIAADAAGISTVAFTKGSTIEAGSPSRPLAAFPDAGPAIPESTLRWLLTVRIKQAEIETLAERYGIDLDAVAASLARLADDAATRTPFGWFGASAALFGHNAPELPRSSVKKSGAAIQTMMLPANQTLLNSGVLQGGVAVEVSVFLTPKISVQKTPAATVDLEGPVPAAVVGARVLLQSASLRITGVIAAVQEMSRNDFGLRQRVTRVTLAAMRKGTGERLDQAASDTDLKGMGLLTTSVQIATGRAAAEPALLPTELPASVDRLHLDGCQFGLKPGAAVIVAGTRADPPYDAVAEAATIADVELDGGRTVLVLSKPLKHRLLRASVRVAANVVRATHGETVAEILGSGDGRRTFQRFALRQAPLTRLAAASASGVAPEIEIRVDGIAWTRVDSLASAGPTDKVFALSSDLDGATVICFGDGTYGSRLPTGSENVVAHYRRGLGTDGLASAGQLTLLLDRPAGVKAVDNPLPATGGEDAEDVASARQSMPVPLKTIGRVVTLRDYADFARAFAGVGKARADWVTTAAGRSVLVTIAGAGGAAVAEDTPAFASLLEALHAAGDETTRVMLRPHRPVTFDVALTLAVDPAEPRDKVADAAIARLRRDFGFDRRDFAQPVYPSEIVASLHAVPGVRSVDLDDIFFTALPPVPKLVPPTVLLARGPETGLSGHVFGAQLLTLQGGALDRVRVQ